MVVKYHALNILLVSCLRLTVAVSHYPSRAATDCDAWEEDAQYVTAVRRSTGVRRDLRT